MCIVLHDVILWKNEKFTLTEKKFRQINYLVTLLVKPLLSRNFCQKWVRVNFCNFHTVDVQIFLAKLLLSRIFCQKCDNLNFFNFHTFTIFFSREKEWKQLVFSISLFSRIFAAVCTLVHSRVSYLFA